MKQQIPTHMKIHRNMSSSGYGSRGRGNPKPARQPFGGTLVDLKTGSGTRVQYKNTTIYVTVDNSGSMRGSKLEQVIKSIQQIVDKVPDYFRLVFRSFSEEVVLLVTKKKKYLEMNKVYAELRKTGGMTALYDAWGQTMKEIDHKRINSTTDNVYVLIFTDGQDNASKEHTLGSVMDLVGEKISSKNVHFSFVQAGTERKAINALEEQFGSHPRCQILSVEDSAKGIKFAFEKVTQKIQLVFRIEINRAPLITKKPVRTLDDERRKYDSPREGIEYLRGSAANYRCPSSFEYDEGTIVGDDFQALNHGTPQLRSGVPKLVNGYQLRNESRSPDCMQPTSEKPHFSNLSSSVERLVYPQPPPYTDSTSGTSYLSSQSAASPSNLLYSINQIKCPTLGIDIDGTPMQKVKNEACNQSGHNNDGSKSLSAVNENQNSWKLRVDNIPISIEPDYVVYSFCKRGECQLLDSGNDLLHSWVLLSYATEQLREAAFGNMGGHVIGGNKPQVCLPIYFGWIERENFFFLYSPNNIIKVDANRIMYPGSCHIVVQEE
ncbi:unnamed protein product [Allacma fusca]|uniref:VWFA domain-containing protein n=1 Tax=Allacma fusca TaxID=39272 RepID=A0A8J2LNY5_9HEXA|nr:unnamed protein product [Allacma fusca]